ncbi:MAG: DNA mismatch endonuclease Vsr [Deltaproteobacteria bacterium]|nr:DNA mismatch endonuclease Vsr [Deltaproteobacteria bacterium]
MTDVFSKDTRAWIMRQVHGEDTKPELVIRSLAHRLGYRFRLHVKNLPGKPDLVFPSRKKVIFVHGCFWHGHKCHRGNRMPKTNVDYWKNKIKRNIDRYIKQKKDLKKLGWESLVIWECQIRNTGELQSKISSFLK